MLKLAAFFSIVLGIILWSYLKHLSRNPERSPQESARLYWLGYFSLPACGALAVLFAYLHGIRQK